MNVFDDQRFLVRLRSRAPDGAPGEERRVSWREIMTGQEEYLPFFGYGLEYMNIAALQLCVALTQAFLEPATVADIVERLDKPVPADELEDAVAPYREQFGIDEGHRFMQGQEPARDNKGRLKSGDLSEVLLTIKKGDKEFLNRPAEGSAVRPDQIPLLLFSRATFFEKSAGAGYLTGSSGDLEVRTFLTDPNSLRNTIWLNVLAGENYRNRYMEPGESDGYDTWMWVRLPPTKEVPQSAISLRSALFWTVASMWVDIRELQEPRRCVMTGDLIEAGQQAGIGVVVKSTKTAFGATVKRDDGQEVRQSFFVHPNAPYKTIVPQKGPPFDRHLEVLENSGLIGQMGGLFYATRGKGEQQIHLAPTVEQIYQLHDILSEDYDIEVRNRYDLLCFGFQMLSSKKNVHGGYESEMFTYPILGSGEQDRSEAMDEAAELLQGCANRTQDIENILRQAVQRCIMKETDAENKDGRIVFKDKSKVSGAGILRDVSRELWSAAGDELRRLMREIEGVNASGDPVGRHAQRLLDNWTDDVTAQAERIFRRYFDDYSASPQHLLAAHDAQRLFYGRLRKMDSGIFERRADRNKPPSNDNKENNDE